MAKKPFTHWVVLRPGLEPAEAQFFEVFATKIPAAPAPGTLLTFVCSSFEIAEGGFAEIETTPPNQKVTDKPVKLLVPLHFILTVAVVNKDTAKRFGFTTIEPSDLVKS